MEPKIQKITHKEYQSSAAAMVAWVDDLLIEIFLPLPVKSLIRFKSVSKHWQSLISDPGFRIRRNPNPNPATGLILQGPLRSQLPAEEKKSKLPYAYIVSFDGTSPQIRTLKFIDPWPCYDATTIRSSCKGLILMSGIYLNNDSVSDEVLVRDYYVCNPTTNKHFKLPQIQYEEPAWIPFPMCLAFDPSKSPHYKVVCAMRLQHYGTKQYQFMVYSSETGCWRKSRVEPLEAATSVNFQRGVYWNGAMHWVSSKKFEKSIYFDPDDDRMSLEMMPTPPILHNDLNANYFGESRGHLHYIGGCWNWSLDVYELRMDYSEWFVKFRINHNPHICAVVRGKSDDDDDSFCVLLKGGRFVRYNFLLNKTSETICQVRGTPLEYCFKNVSGYVPFQHADSLCSV